MLGAWESEEFGSFRHSRPVVALDKRQISGPLLPDIRTTTTSRYTRLGLAQLLVGGQILAGDPELMPAGTHPDRLLAPFTYARSCFGVAEAAVKLEHRYRSARLLFVPNELTAEHARGLQSETFALELERALQIIHRERHHL
jgi:hypothetical protein